MELFRYPVELIWLTLGFAALLFLYYKARAASASAAMEFMDAGALKKLSGQSALERKLVRDRLYLAALALLLTAAAGPQWGMEMTPVTDLNGSLVVAVDTSASMAAKDLKPSRIANAKLMLNALADRFQDYRMGIVAFSGDAYVQCPLTTDSDAIKYFLSYLAPGILPVPGTNIASAITTAETMLGKYSGTKVLVLITDGEDLEGKIDESLNSAAAQNMKIFTVGVGKAEGELIPVTDQNGIFTGYKKDPSGKTVVTHLDEANLLKIAQKTGAEYIRYGGDPDSTAEEIRATVGRITLSKTKGFGKTSYMNRYRVPLLLAFLLLLIELMFLEKGFAAPPALAGFFKRLRRTPAAALLAGLSLLSASAGTSRAASPGAPASAEPTDLNSGQKSWASPESLAREGNSAYDKKDFPKAYEYYSKALEKSPKNGKIVYNKGAAFYRMEDYAKAAEDFEEAAKTPKLKSAASYNAGNAYYKLSDLGKAVEKYREAIISGPKDSADAKYNLQVALEQQKEKKNKKQDQKKQDQQQQQKKQEDKNGGKDQEKQDQNDQKKKEEQKKQEAAQI